MRTIGIPRYEYDARAPWNGDIVRSDDLYSLPANLPVPTDDGACRHVVGLDVPPIDLPSTARHLVRLGTATTGWPLYHRIHRRHLEFGEMVPYEQRLTV